MKTTSIPSARDIGITGKQEAMVYDCLSDGARHTLDEIRFYMLQFGVMARETTISARIRDINGLLRGRGMRIAWEYVKPGSRNTVYWLE